MTSMAAALVQCMTLTATGCSRRAGRAGVADPALLIETSFRDERSSAEPSAWLPVRFGIRARSMRQPFRHDRRRYAVHEIEVRSAGLIDPDTARSEPWSATTFAGVRASMTQRRGLTSPQSRRSRFRSHNRFEFRGRRAVAPARRDRDRGRHCPAGAPTTRYASSCRARRPSCHPCRRRRRP